MVKKFHIGGVAAALSDPMAYLRAEVRATETHVATSLGLKAALEVAAAAGAATVKSRLVRAIEAVDHSVRLAEEQLDILRVTLRAAGHHFPAGSGQPAPRLAQYGLNNLEYLRVDWCHTPEGEKQIATIEGVVRPQIEKYAARDERALMLGAGTGRLAVDLAGMFQHLTAVELCFAYAHMFHRLKQGPIDFYRLAIASPMSAEQSVRAYRAELRARPEDLHALSYIIADARGLPLEAHSVATVLSIYFTDVLPVSELFAEIDRVLRPGGTFIHFGPLHYHFFDRAPAAAHPPDELREVLIARGYDLLDETSLEMPFFDCSAEGSYNVHRVWAWVLRRR